MPPPNNSWLTVSRLNLKNPEYSRHSLSTLSNIVAFPFSA
jgi:hypothetical protein